MDSVVKNDALRRLSVVEGHLRKVRNMLEEDAYCPDVIHQSQAVQAALKKIDEVVLHGHLHSCVLETVHNDQKDKEKMVEEILDVFKKTNS